MLSPVGDLHDAAGVADALSRLLRDDPPDALVVPGLGLLAGQAATSAFDVDACAIGKGHCGSG